MQDLLFGVTPLDPVAFALAPAILLIGALAACLGQRSALPQLIR